MNDIIKKFEEEICKYCRNSECGKGIVISKEDKKLQMKCCDYYPKDEVINSSKYPCQIIRYYKLKGKKNENRIIL